MKNYVKPSMKYIELRVEESLAGIGSSMTYTGDLRQDSINEGTVTDIWSNFWLKVLRK